MLTSLLGYRRTRVGSTMWALGGLGTWYLLDDSWGRGLLGEGTGMSSRQRGQRGAGLTVEEGGEREGRRGTGGQGVGLLLVGEVDCWGGGGARNSQRTPKGS